MEPLVLLLNDRVIWDITDKNGTCAHVSRVSKHSGSHGLTSPSGKAYARVCKPHDEQRQLQTFRMNLPVWEGVWAHLLCVLYRVRVLQQGVS